MKNNETHTSRNFKINNITLKLHWPVLFDLINDCIIGTQIKLDKI